MRRVLGSILIAAGMVVPACSGQSLLDEVNFKSEQLSGIHLVGISVFAGYATTPLPLGGYSLNASTGTGGLSPDESYGASVSLGWQHHAGKTDVSVMYTGSYAGMVHYSNLNAFNQSISLSAVRTLTPRWTVSVSASGQDSTIAQYLFQPSSLSVITQVPATFDDLAAALSIGRFTSTQAASLLTGASLMQTPGRSLLLGNRVLSYNASASLGYAFSPRLQFHFASFAAAGETRLGGQDGVASSNYVMPRSLGANAGIGFSYSLSPVTDVGVNVDVNRTLNHFQDAYASSASAFLARKVGIHWFLRVQGGGSYGIVTQQTYGSPKIQQVTGGGSLGFHTNTHTLVASYDRSASDTFGFAVGSVTTMSGAWSWRRAGSRWSVFSSFGEEQMRNTGFASLSGWQASAGMNTSLNAHTTLSAQYVYMKSTGTYVGTFNNVAVQSVRLSLGWAPQAVQR